MSLYAYYKAESIQSSPINNLKKRLVKNLIRIIPNVLIVVGATAVTTVTYPMLSYQLTTKKWESKTIALPIPKQEWDIARGIVNKEPQNLGKNTEPVIAYGEPQVKPEIVTDIDYTKAENWFTQDFKPKTKTLSLNRTTSYTITIPKLDIKDMLVEIGGNNLDKHLIHYAGTALPGEYGNPVVFGHSVLPVFYNPKSYMSVFSKIPTLEKGDEVFVDYDGIEYKYIVDSYHEVQPDQVELLEQRYDRRTLTLVTCVPPGTYLRRGVILATLEE
jgi:sortase A